MGEEQRERLVEHGMDVTTGERVDRRIRFVKGRMKNHRHHLRQRQQGNADPLNGTIQVGPHSVRCECSAEGKRIYTIFIPGRDDLPRFSVPTQAMAVLARDFLRFSLLIELPLHPAEVSRLRKAAQMAQRELDAAVKARHSGLR